MTTIEEIHIPGFEKVLEAKNPTVGLHAFIALHNTTLGPGLGGTRIFPYATKEQALTDVLRLSQGMTSKSAITKVGFGGAKAVIVGDHRKIKTPALFKAYGEVLNTLKGQYITAEDIGTTTDDVAELLKTTPYVVGLPFEQGGGGDPSPFTAWGVVKGIEAVCSFLYGSTNLEGKRIAIQGLGKVGAPLAGFLFWRGAKLFVADPDEKVLNHYAQLYNAEKIGTNDIHKVACDIYAPCALGGVLNDQTIPELKCQAIAGCANNQLLTEQHAEMLQDRSILYAPDYVINAGGLINVALELLPQGYNSTNARHLVNQIEPTLTRLFTLSAEKKITPLEASIHLTQEYLDKKIGKRTEQPHFQKCKPS